MIRQSAIYTIFGNISHEISHYIPLQTIKKVPLVVFDALRSDHRGFNTPSYRPLSVSQGIEAREGAVGAEVFWHKKYSCCISL